MVEQKRTRLDRTLAALSDPRRREMFRALSRGERSISDIADPIPLSFESVSKHLRVLERAGLVHRRRSGRTHYFSLRKAPLKDVTTLLDELNAIWIDGLDKLAAAVESAAPDKRPAPEKKLSRRRGRK